MKTKFERITPKEFIDEFIEDAKKIEAEYGIPYLIVLAQAALESGWGNSAPNFNFFGVKFSKKRHKEKAPQWTKEYYNSDTAVHIQDNFAVYENAYEAFEDYANLLKERFSKAFEHTDEESFIKSIQQDHGYKYATDPDYIGKILSVMATIKNHLPVEKTAAKNEEGEKPSSAAKQKLSKTKKK